MEILLSYSLKTLEDSDSRAVSGLDWGFETESIILEILGDTDEIREEPLLDLLIQRPELQTMLASSAEFIAKIPELDKKFGYKNNPDIPRLTIRDELKCLIYDLTSGEYHGIFCKGAHQKLKREVGRHGNNICFFIRRITDEYSMR